jgi:hypothetical protein
MGRLLYKIVDTVILVLCLPFYAVVVPLFAIHQAIAIRTREVRPGQQIRRWSRPDVQEELRVVDVSRLDDGLVGVQRRSWNVLYGETEPAFPESVEFCTLCEFWFGSTRLFGRGT